MALEYTGNASFMGVNFAVIQSGDGAVELAPDDVYHYQADDIPYSDDSVLQIGGRQSGDWQLDCLITAANLSAFLAKRKQSGALTVHGTTYSATLLGVTNKRRRPDDYLICTASFRV